MEIRMLATICAVRIVDSSLHALPLHVRYTYEKQYIIDVLNAQLISLSVRFPYRRHFWVQEFFRHC